MSLLQTQDLSLGYGPLAIIEALNLAAPSGQITALIGPNGCGKSTVLRGMARLLRPRHGSVLLDGRAIHSLPTKQMARELGILPQAPSAPEGISVRELVAQGRYPHQDWFQQWSQADEQALQTALDLTHLQPLAERAVDTLSGGQRQRAWIAMALAQETNILLLDEPTTYLDLAHQLEILNLLADLNQQGKTIIMVLHDLNLAGAYADRLVALREGQIYAQGSPTEVLTEETVEQVFGIKSRVVPHPVTGLPLCLPLSQRQTA